MNLGKLKWIVDRQRSYFYYVNTAMIIYLFFDRAGFSWWYLLIIPVFIFSVVIDIKFVVKDEIYQSASRNKVILEVLEHVRKIK